MKKQIENYLQRIETFEIKEIFQNLEKLNINKTKLLNVKKELNSKNIKNINFEQINKILNYLNIKHSDLDNKYNLNIKDIKFEKNNNIQVLFQNKKLSKNIKSKNDISSLYYEQKNIEEEFSSFYLLEDIYVNSYKNIVSEFYENKSEQEIKQIDNNKIKKISSSEIKEQKVFKKQLEDIDFIKIIQKETIKNIYDLINKNLTDNLKMDNSNIEELEIKKEIYNLLDYIEIEYQKLNTILDSLINIEKNTKQMALLKIQENIIKINNNINISFNKINLSLKEHPKYIKIMNDLFKKVNKKEIKQIQKTYTDLQKTKTQQKEEEYDLDLSYLQNL